VSLSMGTHEPFSPSKCQMFAGPGAPGAEEHTATGLITTMCQALNQKRSRALTERTLQRPLELRRDIRLHHPPEVDGILGDSTALVHLEHETRLPGGEGLLHEGTG
jgi:hypothetical protein